MLLCLLYAVAYCRYVRGCDVFSEDMALCILEEVGSLVRNGNWFSAGVVESGHSASCFILTHLCPVSGYPSLVAGFLLLPLQPVLGQDPISRLDVRSPWHKSLSLRTSVTSWTLLPPGFYFSGP